MPYTLPPLPYAADALEPFIDKRTMEIHHGRHHLAYVTSLNAALEPYPYLKPSSVEDLLRGIHRLPLEIRLAVRNHGGGHANHSMFWQVMARPAGDPPMPMGAIADAIRSSFGSFTAFKEQFAQAALSRFGSGWVWVIDAGSRLVIESTANQDSPLMEGKWPVFGLDLWEHAYYLGYQNRRADYVKAWWNVVNWAAIDTRLTHEAPGFAAPTGAAASGPTPHHM